MPLKLIFIGNPGVGESTILNGLAGKVLFRSGVSIGRGLTRRLQTELVDGMMLVDTPGLHDPEAQHQAAAEIGDALKLDGEYKLFFVVCLDAGRVRLFDLVMMRTVFAALKDVNVGGNYSIIVTKVKKSIWERIEGDEAKDFTACLFPKGIPPTSSIFPFHLDNTLDDESDVQISLPDELKSFILRDFPVVKIDKRLVKQLEVDKGEALLKAVEDMAKQIESNKTNMDAFLKCLTGVFEQQLQFMKLVSDMKRPEPDNVAAIVGPVLRSVADAVVKKI